MNIISVIPISRGIALESLSYFSKNEVSKGSVVTIPLRNKSVFGLVTNSVPAHEAKTEIKQAQFVMKKVTGKPKRILSDDFIEVIHQIAYFHACSPGSALYELVPKAIFGNLDKVLASNNSKSEKSILSSFVGARETFVIQENDDDRYAHYKSLIREKFAKRKSVFLLMPTLEDIKKGREILHKGIEDYTYVFQGDEKQKDTLVLWNKSLKESHPILVIATGNFLSLPRNDFGAIIVERENSRGYKGIGRPFIDMRRVAEKLADKIGSDLILGDACLRIETLAREESGELVEYAPLSFRSLTTAKETFVDMRTRQEEEHSFKVISDELKDLIIKNKENNENLFLFAGRKGIAPSTVCSDCETVLGCPSCSSPLILYGTGELRFFLCNKCGKKYDSHTTCKHCGSWKLKTLGIGTELVEKEVLDIAPDTKVFRMDRTTIKTHKKAVSMAEKWISSPGSVLVGTEMALLYIDKKFDNVGIVSLDSYLSIPDFRMGEKIFSMISKMRSLASKRFILQTRKPDETILTYAFKGNMVDFYREELAQRNALNFPPATFIVKVSVSGKKDKVLSDIEDLKKLIGDYPVDVFPAFVSLPRGLVSMHCLIRLPKGKWPDKDLIEKLMSLPPSYTINVDPESLL